MLKRRQAKVRKLTDKQQRFVDTYDGNTKRAAKKAGLSYGYCRRLVTKSNIFEAIRHRQDIEIRPKRIMIRQQRQEFWTRVILDNKQEMKDRLRASELLGKSEADFAEKLAITSSESLTDEDCERIREILRKSFEAAARGKK